MLSGISSADNQPPATHRLAENEKPALEMTPGEEPIELLADAHTCAGDDVVKALGSDQAAGLSDAEARARLERYGRNELQAERRSPAWKRFLAQFKDTLVVLLLVATAISAGLWLHEHESALPYEALAIFAVVC